MFNMIWTVHRNVYLHISQSEDAIDQSKDTLPIRPGNLIDVFMGSTKKSYPPKKKKNRINSQIEINREGDLGDSQLL